MGAGETCQQGEVPVPAMAGPLPGLKQNHIRLLSALLAFLGLETAAGKISG